MESRHIEQLDVVDKLVQNNNELKAQIEERKQK